MRSYSVRLLHVAVASGFSLLACILVSGCGAAVGEVEGTVKYKDKLVKSGHVMFIPDAGNPVYGQITKEGTYKATGVPIGEIKVVVNSTDPRGAGARPGSPVREGQEAKKVDPETLKEWFKLPDEYADVSNPKITVTVKSGKNDIPIVLK